MNTFPPDLGSEFTFVTRSMTRHRSGPGVSLRLCVSAIAPDDLCDDASVVIMPRYTNLTPPAQAP